MSAGLRHALVYGVTLGLAFNPVSAVIGAAPAAAVFITRFRKAEARVWAGAILATAWLVGDGMRVIVHTRDIYAGQPVPGLGELSSGAATLAVVAWVALSLGVGYVLPTYAGVSVGLRATKGSSWLYASVAAVAIFCDMGTQAPPSPSTFPEQGPMFRGRGTVRQP